MQRYFIAAGVLFTFICGAWLLRAVFAVPVRVGTFDVPLWLSVIPIVISGSLAAWAFRLATMAGGGTGPR